MIPAIAGRIPLVGRAKAPALPLGERINHLTGLTVAPAGGSHHDLVARACGVLNYAALVASDVGLPDLATDLCWRQHKVFTDAGRLTGRVAVMSLMPLVNLARLHTRADHGELAYNVLHRLNDAARHRNKTHIDGRTVDLSALTGTDEDHRTVCQELYVTLLVDGARALAQIGRWAEAADTMARHRGIGNRLLDGRQIKIMALMEQGLDQQARDLIDTTQPAEPWERPVALFLHAHSRPAEAPLPEADLNRTLEEAVQLIAHPDPSTAAFSTRTALSALELDRAGCHAARILDALVGAARLDAYTAREALHHPVAAYALGNGASVALTAMVAVAGLGCGALPAYNHKVLTFAIGDAKRELERLLQADPDPG
ncbi:hypothetical protein HG826_08075 [Streptomyces sp. GMY01]|uniref:hypothetical protein n=1 Tax=Streptomyces sp. GMY02 TaxID=1333528 RepID=UPI00146D856D|nr:hypothetical protein [Streptomyces sp. GMY02]NMO33545.1 hypothetical protein [Streptomyces sp. GMY02]